jgi:hypothetical protein
MKFTFNKLPKRIFEKMKHIEFILTTVRILIFFKNNIITQILVSDIIIY